MVCRLVGVPACPLQDARNEMLVPRVVVFDHQAATGIKRKDCMDGWVSGATGLRLWQGAATGGSG